MPTPIAAVIRPLTNTRRNRRRITPSVACFLLSEAHGGRTRFVAFNPTRKCPPPHKWKCTLNSLLLIGWRMLRSARDWWQGLFVKRVQLEYGEREENVGKRYGEIKWKWKCSNWQIDFYSKSEENYKRCTFTNSSPCSEPRPSVSSRHKHSVYKEANDEALEASADQTLQRVPVNAHLNPRNLIFSGPRIKFEYE